MWVIFAVVITFMLVLDLGVFHRRAHTVSFREALVWSIIWITLALVFNGGVYWWKGSRAGLEFLTAYLIEKSLSVDNIFVFLVIFSYFHVPSAYQHRVLFWGVLGALMSRAVFIAAGIQLLQAFHWMLYVFGGFLIVTGVRMAVQHDKKVDVQNNPVIRAARRLFRVTEGYQGQRFFVRQQGLLFATPLFVVLLLVEFTDLAFAIDSIPAVLAVSRDPFIVYTSNVFAILGLRSLYFCLAGFATLFAYLHYGLAAILVFVGAKMMISEVYKVPTPVSFSFIALSLAVSVGVSLIKVRRSSQTTLAEHPVEES